MSIIHTLNLQMPTIFFLWAILLTGTGLHTAELGIHIFVCRTEVSYCTGGGTLLEEGLMHTSLAGDWKIMLCLYSFGIQPALLGKKKGNKRYKERRRKPKSAKANCQMAHHTYFVIHLDNITKADQRSSVNIYHTVHQPQEIKKKKQPCNSFLSVLIF